MKRTRRSHAKTGLVTEINEPFNVSDDTVSAQKKAKSSTTNSKNVINGKSSQCKKERSTKKVDRVPEQDDLANSEDIKIDIDCKPPAAVEHDIMEPNASRRRHCGVRKGKTGLPVSSLEESHRVETAVDSKSDVTVAPKAARARCQSQQKSEPAMSPKLYMTKQKRPRKAGQATVNAEQDLSNVTAELNVIKTDVENEKVESEMKGKRKKISDNFVKHEIPPRVLSGQKYVGAHVSIAGFYSEYFIESLRFN